jgi:uncharacterized membrane protein SpoIIM required for sporulation
VTSSAAADPKRWRELEEMLRRGIGAHEADRFVRLYRAVCDDLALARQRKLDVDVIDRLNDLVAAGHQRLYRPARGSWRRVADLLFREFPRAVRAEARLIVWTHVAFYGSAVAMAIWLMGAPEMVYSVLDPIQARGMEEMYDPSSEHFLKPRDIDTDIAMFGFYIYNNISIALRSFASGVLAGVGSLFVLVFNGIFMGTVAAHLANVGFGDQLLTFVIGHGSLELTAVVLSSAAGLRLGWSVIAPGARSRGASLQHAALSAIPIVYGAAAMLLAAASIEAFWSSSRAIPPEVKMMVGSTGWAAVLLFMMFAGRRGGSRAN